MRRSPPTMWRARRLDADDLTGTLDDLRAARLT